MFTLQTWRVSLRLDISSFLIEQIPRQEIGGGEGEGAREGRKREKSGDERDRQTPAVCWLN